MASVRSVRQAYLNFNKDGGLSHTFPKSSQTMKNSAKSSASKKWWNTTTGPSECHLQWPARKRSSCRHSCHHTASWIAPCICQAGYNMFQWPPVSGAAHDHNSGFTLWPNFVYSFCWTQTGHSPSFSDHPAIFEGQAVVEWIRRNSLRIFAGVVVAHPDLL